MQEILDQIRILYKNWKGIDPINIDVLPQSGSERRYFRIFGKEESVIGCYGANIMTYLMQKQEPLSVTAVTQHFQPDIYPKVDDEATIVVTYPSAQAIIQASWNWPFGRKDMEVYGQTGYVISANNTMMRKRNKQSKSEELANINAAEVGVYVDPFSYLADVVNGKIKVPPYSLYSLDNNIMVVRILEAARESAKTNKTVFFKR